MPIAIIAILLGGFGFGAFKTANQYVKVTYVDEQGIQGTETVIKPILVVKEGDSVTVRSGLKMEGKASRPLPKVRADWDILDVGDYSSNEIGRGEKPKN